MKSNLQIQETNLPHKPYFLKDENDNVIATLYHNTSVNALEYARLFKNAPKMEKVLWKMMEYFSKPDNVVDVNLLNDITSIQIELTEPIETEKPTHWKDRTETTWQDEVYEREVLKNEPLAKIFKENNKNNNKK